MIRRMFQAAAAIAAMAALPALAQAQLNLYMVYLVHNLTRELTRLQIEHRKVDYRCQVLQRDLDWFKDRLRALEDMAVLRDEAVPTGNGGVPSPRSD